MTAAQRFHARIEDARRGGAVVAVPPEVIAALGGGGRIPVRATFDGIEYRGSITRMGGRPILGVLKSIREQLGKHVGDRLDVTLVRDEAERAIEAPPDLEAAFSAEARAAWSTLSYSHRREHVAWIDEAKRPATRERRILQTVERLAEQS